MRYTLAALAFGLGASARVVRKDDCSFTLSVTGSLTGNVGQLDDGQNRVGGNLPIPQAKYTINNGQISSNGKGCILTPPTKQFQCDAGAIPTGGFSIDSNGALTHESNAQFYACPAADNEYNFYTTPVAGQDKCVKVGLTASGCYAKPQPVTTTVQSPPQQVTETQKQTVVQTATLVQTAQLPASTVEVVKTVQPSCPAPSTITQTSTVVSSVEKTVTVVTTAPAPPAVTVVVTKTAPAPVVVATQPAPVTPASSAPPAPPAPSTCPTNLNGKYEYPHLIVPVDSSSPNKAAGTSYNGKVTSTISTIFNFDIPVSYTGTCSLVFLFPEQKNLETSSFTFSGDGNVDFKQLKNVASQSTTFANQGDVATDFGHKTVTPGTSTVISTFKCPAGQAVSYELSAVSGTSLEFFQDYNPSPIGLYITTC